MVKDDLRQELFDICVQHHIVEMAACGIETLTHAETVSRLQALLPGIRTILILVKAIPDEMIERAHDLQYQTVALQTFDDLCAASQAMVSCLDRHGIKAFWPGRQKTPHQKHIAAHAGVGSLGDCTLLISARHGIDVHLESVLVGEVIRIPSSEMVRFRCDACGLCIRACPAAAIEPGHVDRDRCMEYRRARVVGHKGRNYCGLCMKVCPQRSHEKLK